MFFFSFFSLSLSLSLSLYISNSLSVFSLSCRIEREEWVGERGVFRPQKASAFCCLSFALKFQEKILDSIRALCFCFHIQNFASISISISNSNSISAAHQISVFSKKQQRRHFRREKKPEKKRKSLSWVTSVLDIRFHLLVLLL